MPTYELPPVTLVEHILDHFDHFELGRRERHHLVDRNVDLP